MVGRGITQGLVPYRDFFDLKGPYFFFIQALGQLLHRDRLGVYLIQIPFLWASLILIRKLCRLYLSKGKTIAVLFIFLAAHISILWGGNTLEEYMLPVNLLVVYLTIRYLKDHTLKEHSIPPYLPLVTGLCFGIILFAKITVAAPIMGICAAIGLSLLAYRKYKELFLFILYFILGVFIAAVPVFLYYAYHDCLLTMLYCVFEFAYLRSVDFSDPFTIKWELKLAACFFGFFVAVNCDAGDNKNTVAALSDCVEYRLIGQRIRCLRVQFKTNQQKKQHDKTVNFRFHFHFFITKILECKSPILLKKYFIAVAITPRPYFTLLLKLMLDASLKYFVGQVISAIS